MLLSSKANNPHPINEMNMPWQDNDHIPLGEVTNADIRAIIKRHRDTVAKLVTDSFNVEVYPHFTDLVLWRKGRKMPLHKDNGYGESTSSLFPRHFSSVTYLNDDFVGGETIIKDVDTIRYESKPKIGSVVIFTSDERCLHGVNEVISGTRLTMPIWFTKNLKDREI